VVTEIPNAGLQEQEQQTDGDQIIRVPSLVHGERSLGGAPGGRCFGGTALISRYARTGGRYINELMVNLRRREASEGGRARAKWRGGEWENRSQMERGG
jgi:hypothetical protein